MEVIWNPVVITKSLKRPTKYLKLTKFLFYERPVDCFYPFLDCKHKTSKPLKTVCGNCATLKSGKSNFESVNSINNKNDRNDQMN